MDQIPNLKMPYILPSRAQKHVTRNEALRLLDAAVRLSVKSRSQTDVPQAPASGHRDLDASPAAGSHGTGVMILVTKAPSGTEEMARSDGTNWRSIRCGAVIA